MISAPDKRVTSVLGESLKFVSPACVVSLSTRFEPYPNASAVTEYFPAGTAISYWPSFCEYRVTILYPTCARMSAPRIGFPSLSVTAPRMTASEAARLALTHITATKAHKTNLILLFISASPRS